MPPHNLSYLLFYLIKNLFLLGHYSETKDTGPVFFGVDIAFGLRSLDNKKDVWELLFIMKQHLPGTDRYLLGKVVGSLGKKTFYVWTGLAERILEVIVLV